MGELVESATGLRWVVYACMCAWERKRDGGIEGDMREGDRTGCYC